MEDTLAGTNMSASAVHAILEIGARRATTAGDLATALRLEKSTVSRLLKPMIDGGLVTEHRDYEDGRRKHLALTEKGRQSFDDISRRAGDRVATALSVLDDADIDHVVRGLESYSGALHQTAGPGTAKGTISAAIEIRRGYLPGLAARILDMHITYYGRSAGFGRPFEAKVGGELCAFLTRLDNPRNATWSAVRAGRIVGSVSIDGEDLGDGRAHLRWFIVDDGQRGTGIGRKLIDAAMAFVDEAGFAETHLWTFSGLDAARRLYEQAGFELVEQHPGTQWGRTVEEQRFVRHRRT
ncbi:MarR family transcriptional regulator [Marivibrio halodurans]|uniref:MarR family transcriptional regulator n=2 Tax=Marivibrio halodurans TaxID=2039722 RepID=A0A8J7S034_9PROT|nr:MarR family transcriptional regulator [Marivibrio halodurans]